MVVINAAKIKLTGNKLENKKYYKHTGYMGHLKETTAGELMEKRPEDVIENAVRRMLPRSPLGRQVMSKLHVYADAEHKQVAQKPEPFELKY